MAQAALNLDPTIKNVEAFEFEPIKGYPMLQWKGKRPFRTTHYYPAQHKETHGEEVNGWLNQIFWGDNLQVMSHLLKKFRGQVKLIYIDPPFDSKADYKKKVQLKGKVVYNDTTSFEEKQYTDIWTNDEYLQFIYERLILLKELLSEDGVIFVHCDWHKAHHIRCICDEIFGADNFVNEIVWKRADAKGDAGQGSKHFSRMHDTILFYSKTKDYGWNTLYTPLSEEYIKGFYRHKDDQGRVYKLENMLGPGGAAKGNPVYEVMGIVRPWRYSRDKMQKFIEEGRVIQTNPGTVPMFKKYLSESKGVQVGTWWGDISMIRGFSSEKEDYPTQKPEALLERIIEGCSQKGDLVFDCFMGSGTTQAAAMRLGRRFIGADINLGAVQTATKRLICLASKIEKKSKGQSEINYTDNTSDDVYLGFSVYNVNQYDIFRNPVQAKELLIEALELQPLPSGSVFDAEQDGFMVKIMPVNRIATKADLRELVMNIDQREWMRRRDELGPTKAVEHIRLVCMGHDSDLGAELQRELSDFKLKVEVVDILRDRGDLEFKRDSQADIQIKGNKLIIRRFYPMNLLQKLSLQKEKVGEWRELVESVMVDFNYDGAVLQPQVVDIPESQALVQGEYTIPEEAGTIRVKITDLLSESLEMTLPNNG